MKKSFLVAILIFFIGLLSFKNIYAIDNEVEIDKRLKLLNKPAVKSIKSEDGDIIDCVNIYNQPAFDHPALKNHTVQFKPSSHINDQDATINITRSVNSFATQTWKKSGSCPKGTIPILRVKRQDLVRAASLEQFGRKNQQINDHHIIVNGSKGQSVEPNRAGAFVLTATRHYYAAQGHIKVSQPNIDLPNDYSSAQIWVKNNDQFIESGWMVNPTLYGDNNTRFFASWTVDRHVSTGCFDHKCPGFVQVNKDIVLGGSISQVQKIDEGGDLVLRLSFDLDTNTKNWWLTVNNIPLGYWPKDLFSLLRGSAVIVQWGGEVYSKNLFKNPHTWTYMGEGWFGVMGYGATYVQYLKIKDNNMILRSPPDIQTYQDESDCYNALYYPMFGSPMVFFGGPGGHGPYCKFP